MNDWALIAGGRSQGAPWRVGIAGIWPEGSNQPFLFADDDWHQIQKWIPWTQLKSYGDPNGLVFERIGSENSVGEYQAVLLVALDCEAKDQLALPSHLSRYLLLLDSSEYSRGEYRKVFVPADHYVGETNQVLLGEPIDWSEMGAPAPRCDRGQFLVHEEATSIENGAVHFALCNESETLPGRLSPQWLNALAAGAIPVHLADWVVPAWLPREAYVDGRQFADSTALERYLSGLSYRDYQAFYNSAQQFLCGPARYPHSVDCWLNTLTSAIAEDTAVARDTAPKLSVVIPAYNYGRFLKQAVQSVLDQGLDDIEILVLDNASTDGTRQVMQSFSAESRVRYMRNRWNIGPGFNVQSGVRIAVGEYLSFLMADDFLNPGHLKRLLHLLDANPRCAIGYTPIRWVNETGVELQMPRHPGYRDGDYVGGRNEVADLLIHDNYIAPSATIIRRSAYLEACTWNSSLKGAGDWEMGIQLAERFPDFIFVNSPGVSYRVHGEQYSRGFYTSTAPLEDHVELLESVMQRDGAERLKGRELEVAAHLQRRLAKFPGEADTPLGRQAETLCQQLRSLVACNGPQFSIVLTTYNRPAMLQDALRSVAAQTLSDFEVILVNDHGEPVEALLEDFDLPLTYIYKGTNQGLSAARNTGLALARGRYVCYLDDDDMYLPDHLAVLAEAFETQPEAVVYTGVEYATEEVVDNERRVLSRSQPYRHERFDKERLFIQNYIPVNTWAHPRSAIDEVGEFDTGLTAFEDWDMLLRLASCRSFRHVPQVTAEVRMRPGGENESDQMQSRERGKFAALYQEMYSRYDDLDSDRVRKGRMAQLHSLGVAVKGGPASVRNWLAARTLTPVQQRLIAQYREEHKDAAAQLCLVITDMEDDRPALERSLDSVRKVDMEGLLPLIISASPPPAEWQEIWVQADSDDWVSVLNEQLRAASCDWIMLLKAGDELTESGLLMLSLELQGDPQCRAIYCDALYRQDDGEYGAALRPDFNLDYLLSFPRGVAQHWLYHRAHLVDLDGFNPEMGEAMELDLILRLVNQEGVAGLGHISEPLVISAAPVLRDSPNERSAILEHLQARGYGQAQLDSIRPGQYRIDYGHGVQPSVSLIVVIRDDLAMAQRCVMSVLENTSYPHYEILLVDNQSQESATREWLAGVEQMDTSQIKVLRSPELLSHSEACNQAALNADGEYLLLLRSDVAAIESDWLDALMNHGQRPEVGVVGARTVNAEGRVTHAGLILGLEGPAARVFLGEPLDATGYMQRLQVDLNMSAVADSCLLVRKSLFIDVGGLDARQFAEQGADVDLCLRISDTGHLVVWTPRATLLHGVEKKAMPVATEDALYAKWLPRLARDPAYNPNFSLSKPGGFKLADPQISWRPLNVFRPVPVVLAHPADETGCGQYRIIQPFNALRSAGLIDGALSRGLMHVTDLERYAPDVVVLQRQISSERLEAMRRMRAFSGAFKVYELDDYLPNLPLKSVHRSHMPKDIVKSLRRGLSYVDRFVVSTEAIAEAFADFHPDIQVRHNTLDPRFWGASLPESERRTAAKPRVGWAGGASHTGDLEMIEDVIKALAGEVEWVFFGMCPDRLRPYIHEYHPGVPIAQYPAALARLNLDLALAPVEQNLFNECKSNLRLLEYGACGYPVICSDVRCYGGDLPVTRVKNRYRDWVDAIRMHLSDPDASSAMGNALLEQVKGQWMLEGPNLERWREVWLPG